MTVAAIAPHTVAAAYAPRRTRRTPQQMEACRMAIRKILEAVHPMTLRGLYYQMVSRGIIDKTERAYENLGRMLCKLRKDGLVPWTSVVDNTRQVHLLPLGFVFRAKLIPGNDFAATGHPSGADSVRIADNPPGTLARQGEFAEVTATHSRAPPTPVARQSR